MKVNRPQNGVGEDVIADYRARYPEWADLLSYVFRVEQQLTALRQRDGVVVPREDDRVSVPRDEVAWLVERFKAEGPEYLYYNGVFQWSPNVDRALRFSRKQDADAVAAESPDDGPTARAVEHMWVAP